MSSSIMEGELVNCRTFNACLLELPFYKDVSIIVRQPIESNFDIFNDQIANFGNKLKVSSCI